MDRPVVLADVEVAKEATAKAKCLDAAVIGLRTNTDQIAKDTVTLILSQHT
jgi:hypothetical protein